MAFRLNDIGTILTVTITDDAGDPVDISGAEPGDISFIFLKPDNTKLTKTATFSTDGTDGVVRYTTVDGDLDVAGLWHIQGFVNISDGDVVFHSDVDAFEVAANLGDY